MEEPGQHLVPVGFGDDLGQREGGGEAKAAVAKWRDHLREAVDEPGCDLAVMGGSAGQAELALQVLEQVREAEAAVAASSVERGERDEKVGE